MLRLELYLSYSPQCSLPIMILIDLSINQSINSLAYIGNKSTIINGRCLILSVMISQFIGCCWNQAQCLSWRCLILGVMISQFIGWCRNQILFSLLMSKWSPIFLIGDVPFLVSWSDDTVRANTRTHNIILRLELYLYLPIMI